MANYITPKNQEKKFTCPHCNTVSQMIYFSASWKQDKAGGVSFDDCSLINVSNMPKLRQGYNLD